jgi:hypothetical protein
MVATLTCHTDTDTDTNTNTKNNFCQPLAQL